MPVEINLNDLTDNEYQSLCDLADQHSMTIDDTVDLLIADLYQHMINDQ